MKRFCLLLCIAALFSVAMGFGMPVVASQDQWNVASAPGPPPDDWLPNGLTLQSIPGVPIPLPWDDLQSIPGVPIIPIPSS